MIQGDLSAIPTKKAKTVTGIEFIKAAQSFLDDMKKEIVHE